MLLLSYKLGVTCRSVHLFQVHLHMVNYAHYASIKIIKNEVGCRDDTVPKLLKQEGTARRIESMQQSSATLKNRDVRIEL